MTTESDSDEIPLARLRPKKHGLISSRAMTTESDSDDIPLARLRPKKHGLISSDDDDGSERGVAPAPQKAPGRKQRRLVRSRKMADDSCSPKHRKSETPKKQRKRSESSGGSTTTGEESDDPVERMNTVNRRSTVVEEVSRLGTEIVAVCDQLQASLISNSATNETALMEKLANLSEKFMKVQAEVKWSAKRVPRTKPRPKTLTRSEDSGGRDSGASSGVKNTEETAKDSGNPSSGHDGSPLTDDFAYLDVPSPIPVYAMDTQYDAPMDRMETELVDDAGADSSETATPSPVQTIQSATDDRESLDEDSIINDWVMQRAIRAESGRVKKVEKNNERLQQQLTRYQRELPENQLFLDFDKGKKTFIRVHPELVKKMKPHQREGVKFMYDSCYGSISDMDSSGGSGCILAHCMGLGKTLQVIALINTVICYPQLKTKRIIVVCPKSTVMNWEEEIRSWLADIQSDLKLQVFYLPDSSNVYKKLEILRGFHNVHSDRSANCLLIGYEAFRSLVFYDASNKKGERHSETIRTEVRRVLINPGADLIILDEGHGINNRKSKTNLALAEVATKRRIILTGTPIQNNLNEYFCMVNFVKPAYLGSEKEFNERYNEPIKKGQHKDSTPEDIKNMKIISFILNKSLQYFVQRKEFEVLRAFLPDKYEYVLYVPLTPVQEDLYEQYLKRNPLRQDTGGTHLIKDYTFMRKIWTHPIVLERAWETAMKTKYGVKERKRNVRREHGIDSTSKDDDDNDQDNARSITNVWWKQIISADDLESLFPSNKMILLFEIIKMCQERGEKCLIFSGFVMVLNMVEHFMKQIDKQAKNPQKAHKYGFTRFSGPWRPGMDYYRIDGGTSKATRHKLVTKFNDPNNRVTRVFLISTKGGGQGINLVGANRAIILDTSWNPAVDQQGIFRIYRLGQQKPCYIYRLLAIHTMEEKVYSRAVTKQAMSHRVADKKQVDRNYNMAELEELYHFERVDMAARPNPAPADDDLLSTLLWKHHELIYRYHTHEAMLDNKTEHDLTEVEKAVVWNEFNKKGHIVADLGPGLGLANDNVDDESEPSKHSTIFGDDPCKELSFGGMSIIEEQRTKIGIKSEAASQVTVSAAKEALLCNLEEEAAATLLEQVKAEPSQRATEYAAIGNPVLDTVIDLTFDSDHEGSANKSSEIPSLPSEIMYDPFGSSADPPPTGEGESSSMTASSCVEPGTLEESATTFSYERFKASLDGNPTVGTSTTTAASNSPPSVATTVTTTAASLPIADAAAGVAVSVSAAPIMVTRSMKRKATRENSSSTSRARKNKKICHDDRSDRCELSTEENRCRALVPYNQKPRVSLNPYFEKYLVAASSVPLTAASRDCLVLVPYIPVFKRDAESCQLPDRSEAVDDNDDDCDESMTLSWTEEDYAEVIGYANGAFEDEWDAAVNESDRLTMSQRVDAEEEEDNLISAKKRNARRLVSTDFKDATGNDAASAATAATSEAQMSDVSEAVSALQAAINGQITSGATYSYSSTEALLNLLDLYAKSMSSGMNQSSTVTTATATSSSPNSSSTSTAGVSPYSALGALKQFNGFSSSMLPPGSPGAPIPHSSPQLPPPPPASSSQSPSTSGNAALINMLNEQPMPMSSAASSGPFSHLSSPLPAPTIPRSSTTTATTTAPVLSTATTSKSVIAPTTSSPLNIPQPPPARSSAISRPPAADPKSTDPKPVPLTTTIVVSDDDDVDDDGIPRPHIIVRDPSSINATSSSKPQDKDKVVKKINMGIVYPEEKKKSSNKDIMLSAKSITTLAKPSMIAVKSVDSMKTASMQQSSSARARTGSPVQIAGRAPRASPVQSPLTATHLPKPSPGRPQQQQHPSLIRTTPLTASSPAAPALISKQSLQTSAIATAPAPPLQQQQVPVITSAKSLQMAAAAAQKQAPFAMQQKISTLSGSSPSSATSVSTASLPRGAIAAQQLRELQQRIHLSSPSSSSAASSTSIANSQLMVAKAKKASAAAAQQLIQRQNPAVVSKPPYPVSIFSTKSVIAPATSSPLNIPQPPPARSVPLTTTIVVSDDDDVDDDGIPRPHIIARDPSSINATSSSKPQDKDKVVKKINMGIVYPEEKKKSSTSHKKVVNKPQDITLPPGMKRTFSHPTIKSSNTAATASPVVGGMVPASSMATVSAAGLRAVGGVPGNSITVRKRKATEPPTLIDSLKAKNNSITISEVRSIYHPPPSKKPNTGPIIQPQKRLGSGITITPRKPPAPQQQPQNVLEVVEIE